METSDWLTVRALLNAGLFVGDLCLVYVIGHMLVGEMRRAGWLKHVYNQVGVALFIHFGGLAITRVWNTLAFWGASRGRLDPAVLNLYPAAAVGSVISFVGVLILAKLFSPTSWGPNRAWFVILIITLFFTGVSYTAVGAEVNGGLLRLFNGTLE